MERQSRERGDGSSTRDAQASYTRKHGRTYHGYKAHINASRDGIIRDYVFDTAKVHDNQHIDALTEDEAAVSVIGTETAHVCVALASTCRRRDR